MNGALKSHSANNYAFLEEIRDGIPVGPGCFAVSFSLGAAAKSAGLNVFQGFLTSLLNNASPGEYADFTVIAAAANASHLAPKNC